jgi:hypothetical protein
MTHLRHDTPAAGGWLQAYQESTFASNKFVSAMPEQESARQVICHTAE